MFGTVDIGSSDTEVSLSRANCSMAAVIAEASMGPRAWHD